MKFFFCRVLYFFLFPLCLQASKVGGCWHKNRVHDSTIALSVGIFSVQHEESKQGVTYPNIRLFVEAIIRRETGICPVSMKLCTQKQINKDIKFLLNSKRSTFEIDLSRALSAFICKSVEVEIRSSIVPMQIPCYKRCFLRLLCCNPSVHAQMKRLQAQRDLAIQLEAGRQHKLFEHKKSNITILFEQLVRDLEEIAPYLDTKGSKLVNNILYNSLDPNQKVYGFLIKILADDPCQSRTIEKIYTFTQFKENSVKDSSCQ